MSQSEAKMFIKTPPEPRPVKMQDKTREVRSKRIWKFLERRDCININCLSQKVNYNPGNFRKYMDAKKKLPEHLLLKLEKELAKYGLFGVF